MPHKRPQDITPNPRWDSIGGWQSEEWGDMSVAFTETGPADYTSVYQSLPDGLCPCPHYMYLFEGRMRAKYADPDRPDDVVEAGEVCFIPAGHVLIYEEPTKALEINPTGKLNVLMDSINELARQAQI